jgi:hypothetical protein
MSSIFSSPVRARVGVGQQVLSSGNIEPIPWSDIDEDQNIETISNEEPQIEVFLYNLF